MYNLLFISRSFTDCSTAWALPEFQLILHISCLITLWYYSTLMDSRQSWLYYKYNVVEGIVIIMCSPKSSTRST
jgi:hypothetical protein